MAKVLLPLPSRDFDPTESAVPWKILRAAGVDVVVATPDARAAECDQRMLSGAGLGLWRGLLRADARAREAYAEFSSSPEFLSPVSWPSLRAADFDGLVLPGGHAPGMKEYLESPVLQSIVADFIRTGKPVGAICHGVVLAARSKIDGQSVLHGRRSTALLASQELSAWMMTCAWLGSYYRTYPQTVESEVKWSLAFSTDFVRGPLPLRRDSPDTVEVGFALRDRNYVSARWPGDAHRFATEFLAVLRERS